MNRIATLCLALLLAACGSKPQVPDWQMNAHDSLQRYVQAFMAGDTRVAVAEFARARGELARTGDASLVARVELTRCALRLASLELGPCTGFEPLRADAAPAELAYADYLSGRGAPPDPVTVTAMVDPVARLVAAGVLFETGRANPDVLQLAVDTAAAQGWRRPLLAWLGAQAFRAEQGGAAQEAQRLRRRIALVAGER